MKFTFEDNGMDQNVFQGDSIALKMEFQANQTEREERYFHGHIAGGK